MQLLKTYYVFCIHTTRQEAQTEKDEAMLHMQCFLHRCCFQMLLSDAVWIFELAERLLRLHDWINEEKKYECMSVRFTRLPLPYRLILALNSTSCCYHQLFCWVSCTAVNFQVFLQMRGERRYFKKNWKPQRLSTDLGIFEDLRNKAHNKKKKNEKTIHLLWTIK